ncbi:MAG: hemolysin III family protein [bacterium]|nr:hemolysin III family protein [bacterium]
MKKDKREITSSLTHLAGALFAAAGTIKLAYDALGKEGAAALASVLIFGISMVVLYSTSSLYHWCCAVQARAAKFMQRLDHIAIFLLIAGTYTPICVITLGYPLGYIMLSLVWGAAAAGLLMKIFWMEAPVWLSCSLYVAMGWIAAFFAVPLARALTPGALVWLVAGGLLYTTGAVIFGLERPRLSFSWFGSHELFHLFVMGGSLCHYITVSRYLA